MTEAELCSVSIVSHGHGPMVAALLDDLERECLGPLEVVIVRNVPEDESYLRRSRPFPVTVIRNRRRLGFGANHNQAFALTTGRYFVVANPDVRLASDPLPDLVRVAREPRVAICGPQVVSRDGAVEDSARRFPTIPALLRRRLLNVREPDYAPGVEPITVDWLAGIFLLMRREAFARLDGFDERFDMYFEDVDLCRRARLSGAEVVLVPSVRVQHDAQRASRRHFRHAYWHLASAVRYFARTTADERP